MSPDGMDATTVTVRMYRAGLGDCFLLTFHGEQGPVYMLIDCGVIVGTQNAADVMTRIAEDIKEKTNGRLDVVVATHEHWDHLSGFLQAKSVFENEIDMKEIWLAWTEEPGNPRAKELKEEFGLQINALAEAVRRWEASGLQPRLYAGVREVVSFFGELLSAGPSTADALKCLTNRAGAEFRYLTPGQTPFPVPGVEGVRVYVLGPPSEDEYVRKLLPRKESGEAYEIRMTPTRAFLAALESGPESEERRRLAFPFDEYYMIPKETALSRQDDFFQKRYGDPGNDWRRIDEDWLTVSGQLALDLDNKTNNTCLALAFEIVSTGEVLLFPGDAQVGNWASWKKVEFSLAAEDGESETVTSKDLLERTVFYKVGHHGSHNATHRAEGLELMKSADLVAMIPVNRDMAKKKKWRMPFQPLLQRLTEKCRSRVIHQDDPIGAAIAEAEKVLSKSEAARFKNSLRETDLFVECDFPL